LWDAGSSLSVSKRVCLSIRLKPGLYFAAFIVLYLLQRIFYSRILFEVSKV